MYKFAVLLISCFLAANSPVTAPRQGAPLKTPTGRPVQPASPVNDEASSSGPEGSDDDTGDNEMNFSINYRGKDKKTTASDKKESNVNETQGDTTTAAGSEEANKNDENANFNMGKDRPTTSAGRKKINKGSGTSTRGSSSGYSIEVPKTLKEAMAYAGQQAIYEQYRQILEGDDNAEVNEMNFDTNITGRGKTTTAANKNETQGDTTTAAGSEEANKNDNYAKFNMGLFNPITLSTGRNVLNLGKTEQNKKGNDSSESDESSNEPADNDENERVGSVFDIGEASQDVNKDIPAKEEIQDDTEDIPGNEAQIDDKKIEEGSGDDNEDKTGNESPDGRKIKCPPCIFL